MKISVITPTFNSEKTIAKNVESVLKQSYKDFEHIIIDNLSSDKTLEIVKKLYKDSLSNLSIISEKDNGISEAFNKGIKECNGDIVGILNSDDYYFNNIVFEQVINSFVDEKNQFVHGDIFFIDAVYGTNNRKPLLCNIQVAMPYNHPTMFLRKEIYEEVGVYDTTYKFAMDYDFVCRMIKKYGDLNRISSYLGTEPLVVMNSGGASWNFEKQTLNETIKAQIKNGLWNSKSCYNYLIRRLRINLKAVFSFLKINSLIKTWRQFKWN